MFSSYKQMIFSEMEGSSIPSPFHTHNCSFAMFSCFSREKLPNFLIQKRILRVNFLHISDLFSYKQMVFSAIEARFRRIFMRTIAILPGFSTFSNNSRTRLRYNKFSDSRKLTQAQKEMRVG